jgi:hypothetical protein
LSVSNPRNNYDNNPLIINFHNEHLSFFGLIFFEYVDRVEKAWTTPVQGKDDLICFLLKVKNVKCFLKGWGIDLRGNPLNFKKEI